MEIPDDLLCLFSAEIDGEGDETITLEVPKHEVENGTLEPGIVYQIAVLSSSQRQPSHHSTQETSPSSPDDPPVDVGEIRELEIESIGQQGDGIAKVERGFVIVVPDVSVGDRVRAEIARVKETVAFASVEEHLDRAEQTRTFD